MNTSSLTTTSAVEDSLILDFDGTVAPFCDDRLKVAPYPGVMELLQEIAQRNTRIIFVSGRPCRELHSLLCFSHWTELWGDHGLERMLPDRQVETFFEADDSLTRRNLLAVLKDLIGPEHIEEKNAGIAVHWRGMYVERAKRMEQVLRELAADCVRGGEARLLEFSDGLEVRFTRHNKGDAVRALLRTVSEKAELAYLGDDLTDEDAFEALNGRGLTVLVRDQYRPTKAKHWIRPPGELLDFLRQWRDRRPL